jgi:uncharacterized protein YegP (UPF0339 family)
MQAGYSANTNDSNYTNGNGRLSGPMQQPIMAVVSAWNGNRLSPGQSHIISVTVSNRGTEDAVVQVALESVSPLLKAWCQQLEQWLALGPGNSGELRFELKVPAEVMPQWLDYEVVLRAQGIYRDTFFAPIPGHLQIVAPELQESSQDPTFAISPMTMPDRPLVVQLGQPIEFALRVENRSERVDRFRVEHSGLPPDWLVEVDYPREFEGFGLVQEATSLGVNPGDFGEIKVRFVPPALPLAATYLPTLRLRSQNMPGLGLLALAYLQVKPTYQLQSQLEIVQEKVRDRRPALFNLQLANLGNTPRQVQINLHNLIDAEDCRYRVAREMVTIAPQSIAAISIEGQPRRWWSRPWWGMGKIYPFRLDLNDPASTQPIAPNTLSGQFLWMARPWWHLLLVGLAGLGLVGTIAFLIWWNFLRTPVPPQMVEFASEDSKYSEAKGEMVRLRWQLEQPEQIHQLKLTGLSPDGQVISGPLVYEFQDGKLPDALQPFCSMQARLLTCSQVRSDAFAPGKYVFEMAIVPRDRRLQQQVLKAAPVEILAKPLPSVTMLEPAALVYQEGLPGMKGSQNPKAPLISSDGVRLNWMVTMPQDLAVLSLVGRDKEGQAVGNLWFEFQQPGELPKALEPFCRIESKQNLLVCQRFPTKLKAAGDYRFELQAIAVGQTEQTAGKPKVTDLIKVEPPVPVIASLRVNGREAPAKMMMPLVAGQMMPVVQLAWQVLGTESTQVELSPAPGRVPLVGAANFPIAQVGTTNFTLQVKTAKGEVITRALSLEVYAAAAGAKNTIETKRPEDNNAASGDVMEEGDPSEEE